MCLQMLANPPRSLSGLELNDLASYTWHKALFSSSHSISIRIILLSLGFQTMQSHAAGAITPFSSHRQQFLLFSLLPPPTVPASLPPLHAPPPRFHVSLPFRSNQISASFRPISFRTAPGGGNTAAMAHIRPPRIGLTTRTPNATNSSFALFFRSSFPGLVSRQSRVGIP